MISYFILNESTKRRKQWINYLRLQKAKAENRLSQLKIDYANLKLQRDSRGMDAIMIDIKETDRRIEQYRRQISTEREGGKSEDDK
jgi:hypothetical protein